MKIISHKNNHKNKMIAVLFSIRTNGLNKYGLEVFFYISKQICECGQVIGKNFHVKCICQLGCYWDVVIKHDMCKIKNSISISHFVPPIIGFDKLKSEKSIFDDGSIFSMDEKYWGYNVAWNN